ncbi:MAG: flagellar motor protein MotB [Rhodospirillaceae bacterium]
MAKGGSDGKAPIIIKKKKGAHGGHHGGAWKVAYADFVTAMMAFFLLLWLLNVVTSDQKRGISDYFAPSSVSRESSGSGGVLGGQSLTVKGALMSPSSPLEADTPGVGPPGFATEEAENADNAGDDSGKHDDKSSKSKSAAEAEAAAKAKAAAGEADMNRKPGESDQQYAERLNKAAEKLGLPGKAVAERMEDFLRRLYESSPSYLRQRNDENRMEYQKRMDQAAHDLNLPGQHPGESLSDFAKRVLDAVEKLQKAQEETKQFQQTASDIRQAIQSIPELQELAKNLVIDTTPDGLRIQIIDQDQTAMFAPGGTTMSPQAQELMRLLGKAIGRIPNKLSVSGHTDSTPFSRGGRDNWDLSSERANASRRALIAAGIDESRIVNVVGRADKELLIPSDPKSPKNRRIGIVLLRETAPAGASAPTPPPGPL